MLALVGSSRAGRTLFSRLTLLTLLVGAWSGLGCAELADAAGLGPKDDETDAEGSDSGEVEDDEPIDELTSRDFRGLCEGYIEELYAGLRTEEGLCQLIGLQNATGSTAGELFYDCYQRTNLCLQDSGTPLASWRQEMLAACAADPLDANALLESFSECRAPVSSLVGCLEADVRTTLSPLKYTCEDLTPELARTLRPKVPSACQDLQEDCLEPALDLPDAEFVGSCDYFYAEGKRECLEVYCEDCSKAEKKAARVCPTSTDNDATNLEGRQSDAPCAERASSVGGCGLTGELDDDGTAHLVLFVWPTDGSSAAKYKAECKDAGNTYYSAK